MALLTVILITASITVIRGAKNDLKTGQCFLKEVLAVINHTPNQLAVHKRTNTLFFSTEIDGVLVPAILEINTKEIKLIQGVDDTYALASNNLGDEIYFGGSKGIQRYRPIDKTLSSLAITNLDIWWLVFKRHIHFVQFPTLQVFVYKDRTIKLLRNLQGTSVHQFVFDKEGYIFFVNATGLYGVKKFTFKHLLLRALPTFSGMATDNKGSVFVSSDLGIYTVSTSEQKVKHYLRVSGVMAMAFDDSNHLIYSNGQEIARLLPASFEDANISRYGETYFCN